MGPLWVDAAQLWGRVLLFGCRARGDVVARALREGKELHLGSLRGTLDPATFA